MREKGVVLPSGLNCFLDYHATGSCRYINKDFLRTLSNLNAIFFQIATERINSKFFRHDISIYVTTIT